MSFSSMKTIYVGANVERPPRLKYTQELSFVELTFPSTWPKHSTLAKWRTSIGDKLTCAIVAPRKVLIGSQGPLRWDDELEKRFEWYEKALNVTESHAVIETGPELSTSPKDRDRLSQLFERLIHEKRKLIWSPAGIWSFELAEPFAAKHGVIPALDPLEDEFLGGSTLYARIKTLGGRQRLSEGLLYEIAEVLTQANCQDIFVTIQSPRSFREAVQLRRLLEKP